VIGFLGDQLAAASLKLVLSTGYRGGDVLFRGQLTTAVQSFQINPAYSPPSTAAATSDIDGRETAAEKKLEQGAGR
jgi:hypothetical protein